MGARINDLRARTRGRIRSRGERRGVGGALGPGGPAWRRFGDEPLARRADALRRTAVRTDRVGGRARCGAGGADRGVPELGEPAGAGGAVWLGAPDRGARGGAGCAAECTAAAGGACGTAGAGECGVDGGCAGCAESAVAGAPGNSDAARGRGTGRARGCRGAGGVGGDGEVAVEPGQGGVSEGVGVMTNQWPVTDLDAVQRMRVLASALPGGGFARLHIDAPVERVWAYIADLERSIPELIGFIRRFELLGDGTAVARGPVRNRVRFDVELRDGWCVMQDRFVVGGFAAAADGDGTLLAVCGA